MLGQGLSYISEFIRHIGGVPASMFCLLGGIFLVERRGHKKPVHPKRQIDLTTLLQSIPEAAFIVDSNRRIVDANTAAAQLLCRPREELLESDWQELGRNLQVNENGNRDVSALDAALGGTAVRCERRMVPGPENRELELQVSATPMKDENGTVVGALVTAQDITELSLLQRRIGDVERHLAVGQTAAALAHDLNNILMAIGQSAYILETGKNQSEKERRSYIAVIQNAVHRGAELIARVREYLKTGTGVMQPVNVPQLLEEALELTRPLSERAKVEVHSELKPSPDAWGNPADLRRVFTNVIINAIEAMPGGGQMFVNCSPENDRVSVSVTDTGAGITPENRRKIFYPYFTTKKAGTGLGLSGAKKTLRAQGGSIAFNTETGKGTTFVITLAKADGKKATGLAPQRHHNPAA